MPTAFLIRLAIVEDDARVRELRREHLGGQPELSCQPAAGSGWGRGG